MQTNPHPQLCGESSKWQECSKCKASNFSPLFVFSVLTWISITELLESFLKWNLEKYLIEHYVRTKRKTLYVLKCTLCVCVCVMNPFRKPEMISPSLLSTSLFIKRVLTDKYIKKTVILLFVFSPLSLIMGCSLRHFKNKPVNQVMG